MDKLYAFVEANTSLVILALVLLLALIIVELKYTRKAAKRLSPSGATKLINQDDSVLIDIRPRSAYEKGHIAGAVNIEFSESLDAYQKVLKDKEQSPILLVCASGVNASKAADTLRKAGYQTLYLLDGGMNNWAKDNLPVVKAKSKSAETKPKKGKKHAKS